MRDRDPIIGDAGELGVIAQLWPFDGDAQRSPRHI
jgi:hypothetical protein